MDTLGPRPTRGAAPPLSRSSAPSLRRRILGLVAALAATFLGFAAFALWQVQKTAEEQFASQLLGTTQALALAVDREFSRAEALLEGLARLPSLREGKLADFLANARIAAEALGMPVIGVAAPDGLQKINTVAPPERLAAGLPAAEEAMRALRTGRTEISDYVDGNDPARPRIVIAIPVREAGGGPAVWSLGLVLPLEVLGAALAAHRLPPDWVAAVVDRRGTVVARSRRASDYVGQPATPDVRAAVARGGDSVIGRSTSLDGVPTIIAYARGPTSGYGIVLGAPESDVAARRRGTLMTLLLGGVPLALVGMLVATALVRRVTSALRGLAVPDPRAPRLREVEDLADALEAERRLRDQVEMRLRERTAWFETAQQAGRVGVWQRDLQGGGSRWSVGMRRILELPSPPDGADVIVAPGAWLAHVHPEDRDRVARTDAALLAGEEAPERQDEFRILTASGALRWVRTQSLVEADADGRPRRLIGAWIDITERRALEETREAALRQRDLLAGEIHHRIRNSLQLVLSLLLLQARRGAPETAAALRDAATRITTIANVHRRLHEVGPELASDVGAYLGVLAGDLHRSHASGEAGGLELALEPGVTLSPDRLPTVGIIVAELVTNAQKYGGGRIRLALARRHEGIEIAVEDGGPGFPQDFEPARSRGLGMRVATTLARQLGGTLAVDRAAPGGRVVLTIPEAG